MAYPPASDDAEETRRVQENLRRWEIAERQRRKAARASAHSPTSSLVGDVSRHASLLWTGRKSKHASIGASHTALQSQDTIDIVPLDKITVSPTPSPSHTDSDDGYNPHPTDPFANPSEIISPFSDAHQIEDLHAPSISSLNPDTQADHVRPPLPKPLNLPPPRTPPPVAMPLSPTPADTEESEAAEPGRWWHDWLCGCGEGPDRGGDYQAGRTNPFE
ncbi:hypothetical protein CPB84DRAFT_1745048 [Gymnopilus junonius]|uniref:Uncharacterized protein n=1 Tax=Gymnopilus junonius TaxID=109634 RepID=A0A9P5NRL7_GYMJU|nr:hypothetical protein CPB84DRAFT_1745048 [Gymnopilus junonius]